MPRGSRRAQCRLDVLPGLGGSQQVRSHPSTPNDAPTNWRRGILHDVDVEVRRATSRDLAAIVSSLGQEWFFRDCLTRQDRREGELTLALLDGEPIGDVFLRYSPADEPEIRARLEGVPFLIHLEVAENHRGGGVGSRLVQTAERRARELGYDRIALSVGIDNPRAQALYERLGYASWAMGVSSRPGKNRALKRAHEP